ncbi:MULTISPECIES: hypothetical protein [Lysinibacillus]|uniref:hypothetical protein n=1 Tax=Lysinibacillus TaxID=400634 RepID=UPI002579F239|nr:MULTISPECIES: hypothetical protein [Lysinibacillus]
MRITAPDLNKLGVIDGIIPEITGGAHRNVAKQVLYVKEYISVTLKALNTLNAKIHDVYSNKSSYFSYSIKEPDC